MARNAVVGALFASTLLAALVGCGGDTTSPPLPVAASRGGRDALATLVRQSLPPAAVSLSSDALPASGRRSSGSAVFWPSTRS